MNTWKFAAYDIKGIEFTLYFRTPHVEDDRVRWQIEKKIGVEPIWLEHIK